jgi:signal peptidase I
VTSALSVLGTLLGVAFILPSLFGLQRYVITGTSMTGTIDYGSIAFEEVVPVSELQVGDIITYAPPAGASLDHLVTHRIVAIHGDAFRTKGDAVPQRDPWKFRLDHAEQSRVKFSVPYAGYPFIWLADRQTRILVIGVPAGLITLISFGQVFQALRRKPKPQAPDGARDSSASVGV